jgi:hypothetical protein
MVAGSAKYLEARRSLRTKASTNTVIIVAKGALTALAGRDRATS